jgi:aryl-alcohol dehydrogenase-like predicted oxidoreductase
MALVTAPVEVCVSLGLMTVVIGPTPTEIPDSILDAAIEAGAVVVDTTPDVKAAKAETKAIKDDK